MSKIKIEDIREELKKDNWKLISDTYVNLEAELIFECPEGHRVYSSWKKIRTQRTCPICQNNPLKNIDTKVIPKEKGITRILALDQATRITGWSIYDEKELIKYGLFETSLDDEIARDHAIKEWVINMINTWQIDIVGIEGIQYQQNMGVTTFEMLARLQGILLNTIYELKIPYKICPTNTWRAHCKVKGRTRSDKKASMQLLAKQWFDISVTDDEADAIGIGKYIADTCTKEVKIENWE
jgi:Holliday junction resolvasome RuvABC endonuclease subunit